MDTSAAESAKSPSGAEIVSVIFAALLIRALVYACGYFFSFDNPDQFDPFFGIWRRWDAAHYLSLAEGGYLNPKLDAETLNFISRFPPLYPWLICGTAALTKLSYFYSAVLLSVCCICLASALLFNLLLREGQSKTTAWFAALFLNCWPASYFANSAHTESLYLLLTICYFYAIRVMRNYPLSGVFAALQILTRQSGIALLPLHVLLFLKKLKNKTARPSDLLACLLPFEVYGFFLVFVGTILDKQGYFGHGEFALNIVIPFEETLRTVYKLLSHSGSHDEYLLYTVGIPQLFLLIAALLVIAGSRRLPIEYTIYGFCYVLMLSLMSWNISAFRYTFGLFTLPVILASLRGPLLRPLLLAICAGLLVCFLRVYIVELKLL